MNRFNHHLNSHFHGCKLLSTIQDTARKRIIKIFAIPDQPTLVGFSDGWDSWVGPALHSFHGKDLSKPGPIELGARPRVKLIERHKLLEA